MIGNSSCRKDVPESRSWWEAATETAVNGPVRANRGSNPLGATLTCVKRQAYVSAH